MLERIRGKAIRCLILTIFWAGLILLNNPFGTPQHATRLFINEWLVIIALSYLVVLLLNNSPSRNFLVISIVIGLLFVFCGPFRNGLDENTHYFRSFAISEGYWHDAIDAKGNYGALLPSNFNESLAVTQSPIELYFNSDLATVPYSSEKEWYTTPYMSSTLPFDHMIAAIGIKIGTLLHLPIVGVILLARLTDLTFYIVLSYLAIRRIKYYKLVFSAMATIPLAIFLAGSCSQDAVHISATFLFLAITLSCVFEDPGAQVNAVKMETGYIDAAAIRAALGESEDSSANAASPADHSLSSANATAAELSASSANAPAAELSAPPANAPAAEHTAPPANAPAAEHTAPPANATPTEHAAPPTEHSTSSANASSPGKQLSAAQLGGFAKVRQPKKIGAAQIAGILFLFLFVASARYLVYSLLFVLVFFIPKERFEKPSLKKWLILLGVIFGTLLAVYQVYMLRAFPFVANGDVDAGGQMAFVLDDIYGFISILWRYFTGPFLLQLCGIDMLGEFSGVAYVLSMVILLVGVLSADKYRWESSRRRTAFHWVSALTILVMCVLIVAAFYVGCTPVGSADVEGVQMGWLIPFMPLLGIVIADLPVESKVRDVEEKVAYVMVLGNVLLLSLLM